MAGAGETAVWRLICECKQDGRLGRNGHVSHSLKQNAQHVSVTWLSLWTSCSAPALDVAWIPWHCGSAYNAMKGSEEMECRPGKESGLHVMKH
eukprot:1138963-Pelagomonas_calceolata.AAC.8